MALNFTLDSGSYNGRYLRLSCTQTKDVATNRSTINWTLSSIGGNSNYYSTGPTTVMINGTQVYYKSRVEWDAYVFPAAKGSVSGSIVVDHDTDGSKSITVSLSTVIYWAAVNTYSGTWVLDSIPRQAKITSATDFTDVGNPSISFSNPGGFSMNVWLEPNPNGDHLCERKDIPNTGSYTWTLTDAEREVLRSKCSGNSCTVRLGLYTYIGGVSYADYKDKTFFMTENAATKPSVNMGITLDNSQLPSTFDGLYIQGKSRLNVSLSAQGKYSASIKSYWGTVDGKTYNSSPFTSDVIQRSGSVDIVGYAKDSRDFTGSASSQINVMAYSKPLVIPLGSENAIQCYRSDGNGIRTGNSTSVWIKAKRFYYSVSGKNQCALQWRRKTATEAWDDTKHQWEDLLEKDSPEDEYNAMLYGWEFDLKTAYTIQIRAIDDIGEYDIKTLEVSTQDVALHLGAGGKNVSIGSYCDYTEDYTFRSAWKSIFDKGVNIFGALWSSHIAPLGTYRGLDFDTLTTQTGYYVDSSVPGSLGCANYPVNKTGVLEVIAFEGSFAYQTYRTHDGEIYTRSYYVVSGWKPWRQVQFV